MPNYDAGDAYMNHAGGGTYGTGRLETNRTNDDKVTHDVNRPINKIADEAADLANSPAKHVSHAQPWVDSMDDASLRHYLHRETKRVNELHHALEVAEDFLKALEDAADKRGIDIFE